MRCVSNFGATSGPATFDQIFLKVELPLPTPKRSSWQAGEHPSARETKVQAKGAGPCTGHGPSPT